ncbi:MULTISPECIES: hypothetical protein [Sphingobacterium]|uniref:hypothetical protein n=1 Tax=Sphingobacterium TaxID=28453 RepID=UPI00104A7091|nr:MULTISPECIES: hypothetical protein [Sphingobacterium]MCW2260716.1 hypothetical protein [Sphingobacterium kitahiroshimense]TCR09014.1 hypothetical protein EDF67_106179 [Sphingobacterium sp. JUb78]
MAQIDFEALKAKYFGSAVKGIEKKVINKDNVFLDDNEEGIFDSLQLLGDLSSLGKDVNGLNGIKEFLPALTNNRILLLSPLKTDRAGKPYYWVTDRYGRVKREFKLPAFEWVDKLLEVSGRVKIDLKLEELIPLAIQKVQEKSQKV